MLKKKPIGIILWQGKSKLDGQRIMVVATGVYGSKTSKNYKTGKMIQTYILRRDIHPMLARRMGEDFSICGDCKLRECSACYLNLCHGPINVFHAFIDGSYKDYEPGDIEHFKGRNIRIGSYGDPSFVPYEVWENICNVSKGWSGYTHQWKNCDQRLKKYCMASTDSIVGYLNEYEKAKNKGWRSFRLFANDKGVTVFDVKQENELICPASKEGGMKTDCNHCKICSGDSSKTTKDILINLHGDSESMGSLWRRDRYIKMMKKIKNKKAWRRDYKAERKKFREVCPY